MKLNIYNMYLNVIIFNNCVCDCDNCMDYEVVAWMSVLRSVCEFVFIYSRTTVNEMNAVG